MKRPMTGQEPALDDIRREIDAIDDGIVDLLARRIAASAKVRQQKNSTGALAASPIRPAREAAILRRLLVRGHGKVPAELLVRLWRSILTSSTLSQAPVTLHVPAALSMAARLRLRDHFGTMPVKEQADEANALSAANANPGDICAVAAASNWADSFQQGGARVINILGRDMLIFGHAQAQPTGDDLSLLIDADAAAPIWQVKSGAHTVSCVAGFVEDAPHVAGRFPAPIGEAS